MAWVADTDNRNQCLILNQECLIHNQECLILNQCPNQVMAEVLVGLAVCMRHNLRCSAGDIRHNLRCLVEDMAVVTANSLNMEVDLAAVCKVVTVAVWAAC